MDMGPCVEGLGSGGAVEDSGEIAAGTLGSLGIDDGVAAEEDLLLLHPKPLHGPEQALSIFTVSQPHHGKMLCL